MELTINQSQQSFALMLYFSINFQEQIFKNRILDLSLGFVFGLPQ